MILSERMTALTTLITQKIMSGESAAVDENICEDWKKIILPELIRPYDEKDIFNADETGLFFKCLNKT